MLLKLLEQADVLIENFKTGTMEKWGIGYDTLVARSSRAWSMPASRASAPTARWAASRATTPWCRPRPGLVSVNGAPESGPVRIGVPVVDLSTGMNACIGILMALYERNRSGKGQFVDATLYDSAVALHQPHAPNYFMAGLKPKLYGNSHGNLAPYANFPTRGRNIVVGAGNDGQFRKLVQMLGKPELADDPRFRTNKDRLAHKAELEAELRALTKDRDGESFANELMGNGVPSGAVHGGARRHGASAHQASQHGVGEGRLSKCRQPGEALAHAAGRAQQAADVRRRHQGGAGRARLLGGRDRHADRLRHRADRDPEVARGRQPRPRRAGRRGFAHFPQVIRQSA